MLNIILESILGLVCGILMGTTGLSPFGILLILMDFFKLGDYKTNLGTIMYLNLFPITLGSAWEFYKTKQINYLLGTILFITIVIGSYIGSKLVLDKRFELSKKTINYISFAVGLTLTISFLIKAIKE